MAEKDREEETDERRPLEEMEKKGLDEGMEEKNERQGWELKEGTQVGGSQGRSRTGKKWNTTAFSHPYCVKKRKRGFKCLSVQTIKPERE